MQLKQLLLAHKKWISWHFANLNLKFPGIPKYINPKGINFAVSRASIYVWSIIQYYSFFGGRVYLLSFQSYLFTIIWILFGGVSAIWLKKILCISKYINCNWMLHMYYKHLTWYYSAVHLTRSNWALSMEEYFQGNTKIFCNLVFFKWKHILEIWVVRMWWIHWGECKILRVYYAYDIEWNNEFVTVFLYSCLREADILEHSLHKFIQVA